MKIDLKNAHIPAGLEPSHNSHYPMLHVDSPKLGKVPSSGHARIKYKVVHHSASINEGQKKPMHSMGMEVHSFEPEQAQDPSDQSAMENLLANQDKEPDPTDPNEANEAESTPA